MTHFAIECKKCSTAKNGETLKNGQSFDSRCHLVLEQNGLKADYFDEPFLALDNFKAGRYDLLFLDIKMPDMDGFQLYQEMKKYTAMPKSVS